MTHLPGQLKVFNKTAPRLNVEVATLAKLGWRDNDELFQEGLGRRKNPDNQKALPIVRPGSRVARQQEARSTWREL